MAMRDVAAEVGIRAPSVYWYFESKLAIYDAMFAESNRELLERLTLAEWPSVPRALLRAVAAAFIEFSAEDPVRAQLMFQRPIPDFKPSPESYAVATEVYELARQALVTAGVTNATHFDLWTALISGLASQQVANEPGGDRWLHLTSEAVEMFADHVLPKTRTRGK
jgi:AcrR family transcriptional regulator